MKSKLRNTIGKFLVVIILMSSIACHNEVDNSSSISFINQTNENDGITELGMLDDSIMNGLWIEYYPNKVIKTVQFYVAGELQGPFLLFHENGNLKFESQMVNNEFEGKRTVYFDNGEVQNIGYFLNGKQDSIWEFYTYHGGLDKRIRFEKGEAVDTLIDNKLIAPPPPPPLAPSELKR